MQAFPPFCARIRICLQRLAAWVSPMFSALRVASFELHVGIPLSSEGMRLLGKKPNSRAHGARVLIEKEAPPCSGGSLGTKQDI